MNRMSRARGKMQNGSRDSRRVRDKIRRLFERDVLNLALWILAAGVLVSGCGTVRKHPRFDQRAREIQTVTVMPPDVMIERIVFKGDNESLFRQSAGAAKTLADQIRAEFERRGYEVHVFEWSKKMRRSHPDLAYEWSRLRDRHAGLARDVQTLFAAKSKYDDFRLTLGPAVNPFADLEDADILVFSGASGFVSSGGEKTKNFMKSLLMTTAALGSAVYLEENYGGAGHMSVVDGDNGDILWHNFTIPDQRYDLTKEGPLRKMSRTLAAGYPARRSFKKQPMLEMEIPSPGTTDKVKAEIPDIRVAIPEKRESLADKAPAMIGKTSLQPEGK